MMYEAPDAEDLEWLTRQGVTNDVGHMALVLNLKTYRYRTECDELLGPGDYDLLSPKLFPMTQALGKQSYCPSNPLEELIPKIRKLLQSCVSVDQQLARWFDDCPAQWRAFQAYHAPEIDDKEI